MIGDLVVSFISFSTDQFRLPLFHVVDERYAALGNWIAGDISNQPLVCLDALAMIDDAAGGRLPFQPWSSENYDVRFTPEGLEFQNLWLEDDHGRYTVGEAREALENYWRYLVDQPQNPHLVREYRPELPQWHADLLLWEETWERPHPYRGRLF